MFLERPGLQVYIFSYLQKGTESCIAYSENVFQEKDAKAFSWSLSQSSDVLTIRLNLAELVFTRINLRRDETTEDFEFDHPEKTFPSFH